MDLRDLKRSMEIEEAQVAALSASVTEACSPEFHRLSDIIGLDATLKLMLALPNTTITIPSAESLPSAINLASASLAVTQGRMEELEASFHYQVNRKRLARVVQRLTEYYETRKRMLCRVLNKGAQAEIKQTFARLSQGEMPHL